MSAVPKRKTKPEAAPHVETSGVPSANIRNIPLSELVSNPHQPRQMWDDEKDEEGRTALDGLAESVRNQGILQPLVVTNWNKKYLVVCGERRLRAAKMAGLKDVPCVIRPGLTGEQILELAVIENLQREDLTPVDEAHAIKVLMDKCGWSQRDVAKKLGLSVGAINHKLSLLKLSPDLQKDVKKGKLTETQGREIARAVEKVPEPKRAEAMDEVRVTVQKAQEAGAKPNTKSVATIAKKVVEKHSQPATADGKPGEKPKAEPPKPATDKEKEQAKAFAKAVSSTVKAFAGDNARLSTKEARERFAFVLLATQPEASDQAKSLQDFFARVTEAVSEVKRQRMVAKL